VHFPSTLFGPPPARHAVSNLQDISVVFIGGGLVWLRSDGFNATYLWDALLNAGIPPLCPVAHSTGPFPAPHVRPNIKPVSVVFIGGGLVWLRPDGFNATFRLSVTLHAAPPPSNATPAFWPPLQVS
jgi:hypothetical protein